jgi:hypothetical protein
MRRREGRKRGEDPIEEEGKIVMRRREDFLEEGKIVSKMKRRERSF